MSAPESRLLVQIRAALETPSADPVNISGAVMSRMAARAIERMLSRKGVR